MLLGVCDLSLGGSTEPPKPLLDSPQVSIWGSNSGMGNGDVLILEGGSLPLLSLHKGCSEEPFVLEGGGGGGGRGYCKISIKIIFINLYLS